MKNFALAIPLLIISACGRGDLTTKGTPVATEGLPTCDGRNFPIQLGGSSSCCLARYTLYPYGDPNGQALEGGNDMWHVFKDKKGDDALAHRYLGKACTTIRIPIGQAIGQVSIGPCGAGKDPAEDPNWLIGTNTKVFKPVSHPQVCGYQVTKPDSIISSFPEGYTAQTLYPGVTATCPFTLCKADGIPATSVTAVLFLPPGVMPGSSLGRVHSEPHGITLSGAGQASESFPGDVTLIAEPTGGHVRAVFSGDCVRAGEYGQRAECIVKLAPDPKVTVTFECQKGFTCGGRSKD